MELDKKEVSVRIGNRPRELRIERRLTIEKVALSAGLEYTQLSRIELGKINTSIYQVYKISNSLAVPVPDIFTVLNK